MASEQQSGTSGLIAIIVAVPLALVVGFTYGPTMWIAHGGPQSAIERLDATIAQKEEFAAARRAAAEQAESAEQRQALLSEAERLESHVPQIQQRKATLSEQAEAARDKLSPLATNVAALVAEICEFCGDVFLQALTLMVIPLVITSMICGVTSLGDVRKAGRLGFWTITYYLSTGAIAVLIGMILVLVIQPGTRVDDTFAYITDTVAQKEGTTALDTLLNVIRGTRDDPGSGMLPKNLFQAASQMNVLALIVFSIVFAAALTTLGERGRVAIDFFEAANQAIMKMVHLVILFAPVGIFGLVVANITRHGGGAAFMGELARLGRYATTVIVGLLIHSLVLGSVVALLARRNPLRYTYNLLRALLTAMSTASSSATLPVTMECTESLNKVSDRTSDFVLPLGATINMDGTALYEAVAVIFIAQSIGVQLDPAQLLIIFLTATLAAVGAAGIPEAGLVTMVIVLTAVGLPITGIGTILAIDWFLDRLRTTVNVYGDAVGAAVIDYVVPPNSMEMAQ